MQAANNALYGRTYVSNAWTSDWYDINGTLRTVSEGTRITAATIDQANESTILLAYVSKTNEFLTLRHVRRRTSPSPVPIQYRNNSLRVTEVRGQASLLSLFLELRNFILLTIRRSRNSLPALWLLRFGLFLTLLRLSSRSSLFFLPYLCIIFSSSL
jgi:hypothetical protein